MKLYETKFSLSMISMALVTALSFSSAVMAADSDGDGLDDSIERMYGWNPYDAHSPGETDTDKDGLTDLTEYKAFTNMYDPNNPVDKGDTDDDGDTLPKALEVFLMGTDPDEADTDCDGDNDNVDSNPVDGVCEIPEPNPEADNMDDDIRTSEGDSGEQLLAPTVPLQLYYAVEYTDGETHSTESIDPDSDFMTWSLSDNTYASIDEDTGIFEFYNGTPEGTEVLVTATHIDNDDITDTMLITSTIGIPDVNGTLSDDIQTETGDSGEQTIAAEVPLQLYYAVDYTDGETYSTENVALDSDVMTWSLSDDTNASIDVDTGVFEFNAGTEAGTEIFVTATLNANSDITDTIKIVANEVDYFGAGSYLSTWTRVSCSGGAGSDRTPGSGGSDSSVYFRIATNALADVTFTYNGAERVIPQGAKQIQLAGFNASRPSASADRAWNVTVVVEGGKEYRVVATDAPSYRSCNATNGSSHTSGRDDGADDPSAPNDAVITEGYSGSINQ